MSTTLWILRYTRTEITTVNEASHEALTLSAFGDARLVMASMQSCAPPLDVQYYLFDAQRQYDKEAAAQLSSGASIAYSRVHMDELKQGCDKLVLKVKELQVSER